MKSVNGNVNSSARAQYRAAIAKEWVKRNHPEIWDKIKTVAEKRFPFPERGCGKTITEIAKVAASL